MPVTVVIFVVAIIIFAGVIFVGRVISRAGEEDVEEEPHTSDAAPRRRRRRGLHFNKGEQVVGAKCVYCTQRIALDVDGRRCRECGEPVHRKECYRMHRQIDHATEERVGPYR